MSGSGVSSLPAAQRQQQQQPLAAASRKASSPNRARHQIHRSITELTSPVRLGKHHQHHIHTSHHHHNRMSHHRRDQSRDESDDISIPLSAAPVLQAVPRASLDVPRFEGATPAALSANPSRAGSILIPPGRETAGGLRGLPAGEDEDEALRRAKDRTGARTSDLKKSLADLANISAGTTRRLDETYYSVLEKLTSLQNTVVALKELASASAAMNEGFTAESESVLAEAQAQLDAFGQFDEQQARVQALQDRIHGGRERISALSERVDIVRQKVERWERADFLWQNKTRRRIKIVWGVVLGLVLLMLLLYVGARAYAPELEDFAAELKEDAMLAKLKLESGGKGPFAGHGDEWSMALNFSRDGPAEGGDEALRALDEL
ncbi:hypothetical protein N8I77_004228 [Diaporthe amygdali]|uniref:Uncharacterized protein n=1 Tax=Phomopsis amygdali TaxID=1214568 RepID=A0AAD9SLU4_PHOAM|nr:hypothetical protein N8I77_004228 [Diaporthe amygdali]